jgi:1-deoxy-D-xylulose-5-phosphate reductoisomerase
MTTDRKRIAILGSTGSIGVNALKVIRANPHRYELVALGAGRNVQRLREQIEQFKPRAVAVQDEDLSSQLVNRLPPQDVPSVHFGTQGFIQLVAREDVDTVVSAMTGAAGLLPTYEAVRAGKRLALANKETMVMAGSLIMAEAEKRGVSVLPIDSEHSAILQAMQGHPREDLRRVILTASGGPFRSLSLEEMATVTPAQALSHPNWEMGSKITIDSATLMNKGLEAIEAKWFFDLEMDRISILIHPQSIVHSMVEYNDGSIIAQLGIPDMITPISYALSFPHHTGNELPFLELEKVRTLSFEKADTERFPCLTLALYAAKIGQSMPAVLNAANEVAVMAFLDERIGLLDISLLIREVMSRHTAHAVDTIEQVINADQWARRTALGILEDGWMFQTRPEIRTTEKYPKET